MEHYVDFVKRTKKEFDDFPIGFAFNEESFIKMIEKWGLKNEPNDIKKLVGIGIGAFVQKKDIDDFNEMLERHSKELQEGIDSDKDGKGFAYEMFLYELNNHEYGYTCDEEDTLRDLGFTHKTFEENPILNVALKNACDYIMIHTN